MLAGIVLLFGMRYYASRIDPMPPLFGAADLCVGIALFTTFSYTRILADIVFDPPSRESILDRSAVFCGLGLLLYAIAFGLMVKTHFRRTSTNERQTETGYIPDA